MQTSPISVNGFPAALASVFANVLGPTQLAQLSSLLSGAALVPSGAPASGVTNKVPTGSLAAWVDLSGDVGLQLQSGAEPETKLFASMTSNTLMTGKCTVSMFDGSARLYSQASFASGQYSPRTSITYLGVPNSWLFTWCASWNEGQGGWVGP